MGCKLTDFKQCSIKSAGINSYIVGCKCWYAWLGLIRPWRINSYIVGCKFGSSESMISGGSELIVT